MNQHFETECLQEVQEKESAWLAGAQQMRALCEQGAQDYFSRVENFDTAFHGDDAVIRCMDEGTDGGFIHAAGAGILLEGADRLAFIEAARAVGVKELRSHKGCGAAALFREKHGMTDKTTDEVASEQAKRLAEEIGVSFEHEIPDRPEDFHFARTVYYDATGKFDASMLRGAIPRGFVLGRRYLSARAVKAEVKIAVKIAFGEHGFGPRFSSQEPFVMIALFNPDASCVREEDVRNELTDIEKEIATQIPESHGKIRVDFLQVSATH